MSLINNDLIIVDVRTIDWTGIGRVTKGIININKNKSNVKYISNRDIDGIKKQNLIKFKSKPFTFFEQLEFFLLFRKLSNHSIKLHLLNFNTPLIIPKKVSVILQFYEVLSDTDEFTNIYKKIFYFVYIFVIRFTNSTVLAQSDFTKNQLLAVHNINNVIVCPHGFTPMQYNNINDKAIFEFDYIYYVGLNRPRKNLIGLLAAYKKFINTNHNNGVNLVLSGPDFHNGGYPEIQNYIDQYPELKSRVHILGFVDEITLFRLYRDAILLVMPSHLEGGYSYPALEAISAGTPVLLNYFDMYSYEKGPGVYFFNHPNDLKYADLSKALCTILSTFIPKVSSVNHPLLNDFKWEKVKSIIDEVYHSK